MSGIAIYMEGGGDSASTRAQLRSGMDQFLSELKNLARAKAMRWKLVPVGGRDQAFKQFLSHPNDPDYPIRVLLVDAEAALTSVDKRSHLRARDGWDLSGVSEDHIHLMVQTMEAWIVADPEALADYYGQRFRRNTLPTRANLEEEPKVDCSGRLSEATRPTQKGGYQKIGHAADLLALISPDKVRNRCPHAKIMFSVLSQLIG